MLCYRSVKNTPNLCTLRELYLNVLLDYVGVVAYTFDEEKSVAKLVDDELVKHRPAIPGSVGGIEKLMEHYQK